MYWAITIRIAQATLFAGVFFVASDSALRAQTAPLEIPFVKEWAASPHARFNDEAFNHWNAEGEVPVPCSRCHTTPGFRDYIGADGTPPGLDGPAPVGTVITCVASHNDVTRRMDSVTFPSGETVTGMGAADARCMTCHQGLESTVSVDEKLKGLEPDRVSGELRFINIHYRAAGATRYGSAAKGAYQYAGKSYAGFFMHDAEATRCADCHELHTVKVRIDRCAACHKTPAVVARSDLVKIRHKMTGDYDGDGNTMEGLGEEIAGLRAALLGAIQTYGKDVAGQAIVYDEHAYPYFFNDRNGDGKAGRDEAVFPNQYRSWTPRLLRAAYNYQFSLKDPGVYTHNPRYVIQTMYDSLADLGARVRLDMDTKVRPD